MEIGVLVTNFFYFPPLFSYSLKISLMYKAWRVLWTGTWYTQTRSTSLGISLNVSGPTSQSSSSWRRRKFKWCHSDWDLNGFICSSMLCWCEAVLLPAIWQSMVSPVISVFSDPQCHIFFFLQQDWYARRERQCHGQSLGHVSAL